MGALQPFHYFVLALVVLVPLALIGGVTWLVVAAVRGSNRRAIQAQQQPPTPPAQ